jgi:hypothetical protein
VARYTTQILPNCCTASNDAAVFPLISADFACPSQAYSNNGPGAGQASLKERLCQLGTGEGDASPPPARCPLPHI